MVTSLTHNTRCISKEKLNIVYSIYLFSQSLILLFLFFLPETKSLSELRLGHLKVNEILS